MTARGKTNVQELEEEAYTRVLCEDAELEIELMACPYYWQRLSDAENELAWQSLDEWEEFNDDISDICDGGGPEYDLIDSGPYFFTAEFARAVEVELAECEHKQSQRSVVYRIVLLLQYERWYRTQID